MRTWTASTRAAALLRAFTTRACHNHLSRRWRSKQHQDRNYLTLILAGGELLLERRQFGKWRIGVDREFAFARWRAGCERAVRRAALGALVASALVAASLVAASAKLALGPFGVPAFGFKAFARRTALILTRFLSRRALCCRSQ